MTIDNVEHDLIGQSSDTARMVEFIRRVSASPTTVLIRGETGTGKGLVARALHRNSPRRDRPFVAINCAVMTDSLAESVLFGYERGAFTGAMQQRKGKFELADGGTLFLDEIGELAPDFQAHLLRALQERQVDRIGGTQPVSVDVRVIAATNCNLEHAVAEGKFREDLYYRLNVISITTPALRDRPADIPVLARHFLEKHRNSVERIVSGISPEAMDALCAHDWPGNVRELESAIQSALVLALSPTDVVMAKDLPSDVLESSRPSGRLMNYREAVHCARRSLVESAMQRADGNYRKAALLLRVNQKSLHPLLKKYGLTHLLR